MKNRILSIITVLALCLSMLPAQAVAAEPETDDSLCPHHAEHTAECGYMAPTKGTPCQHEHTAGCRREETICVHTHTEECYSDGVLPAEGGEKEADACTHVCTEESGCITSVLNCQHEHDETCGYTPANPGQPCGYDCRICPVQELIDALPDADSITAGNRAEVETRLAGIDAARAGLTDEEAEQLDTGRYQAAVSALSVLDGQAGADVPVLTEGSVSYRTCDENGQNWETKTCNNATAVAASDTAWGANDNQAHWYVVNSDITISDRIYVTGNVHLILVDECTLTVNNGINVAEGNSLTIYGQNKGSGTIYSHREAYDNRYYAAIGGGNGESGGTITINGGTLDLKSPQQAAAIGGGNEGDGGIIVINGGIITAECCAFGAGIGGGHAGSGGNITIRGGIVTAIGGKQCAGIGAGNGAYADTNGGTITITGGTVTAISGKFSDGIGGSCGDEPGTFSTGVNGNPFIIAIYSEGDTGNAVGDQTGKSSWSGVIFEGDVGKVYGNSITITTDAVIPEGKTLTIAEGQTLTIAEGVTLVNNGTVTINGTLQNSGTIMDNGTISGSVAGNQPVVSASYLDCDSNGQNWQTKTCTSATAVTASDTTWGGDADQEYWYVVDGDITISRRIAVTGNVHLILADGCHLNATQGIYVSEGNSLTIYAQSDGEDMGELTAQGSNKAAGIGGNDRGAGGTITINGGTVTANGGPWAAGIGGGDEGVGGRITINGGTVTAAGNEGAGIGGGYAGDCGTITINGGTVTANGGSRGTGIGGATYNAGGTITINGGTVTANGGSYGAGIGGGSNSVGLTITISGGTVTANSDSRGAGIGGSYGCVGGTITINGGTVTANGGPWAAGIGGGQDGDGGMITISGGTVTANNSIGGGYDKQDQGQFSTGTDGNALIFAYEILGGTADKTNWKGIIFEGDAGKVYGDITLAANAEIPEGKTLAIDEGQTLTIDSGVTLTNNGTIIVKGEITIKGTVSNPVKVFVTLDANGGNVNPASVNVTYNGTYDGLPTPTRNGYDFVGWYTEADSGTKVDATTTLTTAKGHTLYAHWTENKSAVAVTFSGNLTYGGQLTITATVQEAPANTMLAAAALDTMDFYLDTVSDSNKLGTASVSGNTASLPENLTGEKWKPGNHTITAVFSGSTAMTGSTGSGTVTIAKADNSITNLTCADVVYGGTPNPSATATHPEGGITYTYSNQQNGTYGAWNTQNSKGTWYVKASVGETDYYKAAEAVASFSVTAELELTPNASINYTAETLTGLTAGASYSITPAVGTAVTVTASENGTINIQTGWFGKTLSIVKVARDDNYSDSEAQSLSIPTRPAAPATPLKLTKTANSITITNAYSGCEFSADGTSWNDDGAFTGLTAGTAYSVQVRVKATNTSFRSASMTQAVTTVNEDGSTTVKPGETVTTGGGGTTITNDGDKTTIESGGKTTTITPPGDSGTEMDGDGTVTAPEGSIVQTENGPEITMGPGNGGTVDGDGGVTVPDGGTVQVGDTTITPPSGGEVKPTEDGKIEVPGGSTVQTGDGPEIALPDGGTVGGDGGVTVPDGGTVQIGNNPPTTITPPNGDEVKPTDDGGVTVPEGTTVKTGDGPEITVGPGNGGTVGGDGGVTVPGGGNVQVGDDPTITITLPTGGGTVKPNPDGTIPLPGGATIGTGGTTITVPEAGGTYDPGTGTVTENVHTVTFDSQGGSAVSPVTVTHGKTAAKPGNPTRSGYTFGGWYKDSSCTTAWNFDTDVVTGNITLYAKWTVKPTSGGGSGGTYTPPTYPPTVEKPSEGGGAATVSPSRPKRGDTVTVTPKPDEGYEVDKITVTDRSGKPVTVTKNPDGTYSFTQPSGTVKVEVSYKPIETTWNNPFADVSEGAWYYDAVRYVSVNGLMNGYGDGRFGPNDNLTRAQFAQLLHNKEGRPGVNYLLQFGDVASGAWYTEAIRWATSQGIVSGYGNGRFGPNDNITREQLAVMLWRYSGSPAATNKELHFNDADEISGFALDAMRWAVENGIISGYGNGRLGPKGLATRAQVAQMLKNFLGK